MARAVRKIRRAQKRFQGSLDERSSHYIESHALVRVQYRPIKMEPSLQTLSELIKAAREEKGYTSQKELALALDPPTNRSAIAHLEQARRLPPERTLRSICEHLSIPSAAWRPLLEPEVAERVKFESALSELVGKTVSLRQHDHHSSKVAHKWVLNLFGTGNTKEQLYDAFCSVLIFYGVNKPSKAFFQHYLPPTAFRTIAMFEKHIERYQVEAIRLFASFEEAYLTTSQADEKELVKIRKPLLPRPDDQYRERTEWNEIEEIPEKKLPDLGYISASRIKKEQAERRSLSQFLEQLAEKIEVNGRLAVDEYPEKRRRKIGSLLRKFKSLLAHDLLSPLFAADPDEIRREAKRLAPKEVGDLRRMEETQATGQRNLSCYLSADHLDVYVATSMRSDADFVSVNAFARSLFSHESIKPLKLRYFNPTQSWIEDRVAKGLVEALMLRRADFTIYMAQKSDTFGKDSEASVALG
ncbi:MAG: helix-turn-helix transcriptional regulator [Myxococcota bacterium]